MISFSEEGSEYMPAVTHWTIEKGVKDPRLTLLQSLAKKNILPFTAEQEKIFNHSHAIARTTDTYLGPRGYGIVIGAAFVSGLAAVRIAKYVNVSDESPATDAIPALLALVGAAVAGVASMIFTGTLPDAKSDGADARERECIELTKQFDEVGLRLVSLFWSKKPEKYMEAYRLASRLQENLPAIKEKLKAAIRIEKEDERITALFHSAIEYVVSRGKTRVLLSSLENRVISESRQKGKAFLADRAEESVYASGAATAPSS
jgi:hypothetical protein